MVLIIRHSSERGRIKQLETNNEVVFIRNVISNRQTQYHQQLPEIKTPLNIELGLYFNYLSRSKNLITFLFDLILSGNYQKIVSIKKSILQSFHL